MISLLYRYLSQTRGATAIEYGLIAAGIALTITVAVLFLGEQVYNMLYSDLPDILDNPAP